MPVVQVGNTKYLERGLVSPEEWEKIKREVAMELHREIMGKGGAFTDEDPQVAWDFKKDWRVARLPMGKVFGSDYDYWNHVVQEGRRLWNQHAGNITRDYIADSIARNAPEWPGSVQFYEDGLQVWQNGNPVGFNVQLHGPQVDFGPTADFAAFLERWNFSNSTRAFSAIPYQGIGVMRFIERELQQSFAGAHTIYMMPIKPNDTSEVRETPDRKNPVRTFPIIRIVPRHYRR